ncbi:YbhB/YbcL family Raf kinase inhibitor-like protein [Pseudomonas gingeri]|uniref:YbhB/YbcL family Raf kinase inhibitor-like protein n=1 Tax=Pseudomonas gingeri TaxID=117681 RepID=A0A7Y7XIV5_9PSED|nr:YbhB/YbcL family Raf kinase inhibitor-like protein [Pseudomonas gingeri]NWB99627.1 YbhB/YbcL family Raf kinase inhibitor-like protein [Pseudomonas gingeri]
MKLISNNFNDSTPIPGEFAFATPDLESRYQLSNNRNPHLAWTAVPTNTRSFVLICHDPDVPSLADDVNREGKKIPSSLPRVDFDHWLVIDIPATQREIAAGSHSAAITPKGKSGPHTEGEHRHGLNDYTSWFATNPDMSGEYYGYDGPCPPWNDELLHRYVFTLYALDVATLDIQGSVNGANIRAALQGHVLAKASLTGTYTLNPDL